QPAIAARRHGHFGDVNCSLRIDADVVRREEVARRARIVAAPPARFQLAIRTEDADAAPRPLGRRSWPHAGAITNLRDVSIAARVNEHLAWPGDLLPLREVLSIRAEQLNPAILPVGNVNRSVSSHRDAVRQIELPRPTPWLAPRVQQPTVRRESVHARI